MSEQRSGCLGAIVKLFGIDLSKVADSQNAAVPLPFRIRDDFLSPAEFSFYQVLRSVIGSRAMICPKVNLADIFYVARPNENQGLHNRIDRKHVDFLLCSNDHIKPLCGIELDDGSHQRASRQSRDEFVEQVFAAAGLPLVRFSARSGYVTADIETAIAPHLNPTSPVVQTERRDRAGEHLCPKCGVPMVLRTASKGSNRGQSFYGCANYPKCREMMIA